MTYDDNFCFDILDSKIKEFTDINIGLNDQQVDFRIKHNKRNIIEKVKTKSYKRIFFDTVFTLFNFINIILFILIIFTGSYKNGLFIGTVISNTFIGIYQQVRSKRTIDKLCILNNFTVDVLRNSKILSIDVEDIVIDDIIILYSSKQVSADSVIIEGECEVDESMITGESNPIFKTVGDTLVSGSFIISGSVKAQVVKVGKDNYINNVTKNITSFKMQKSHILNELKRIIKYTGIILIPIGTFLFLKQYIVLKISLNTSIISTVAVMVGMIPEGLMLLSSIVMAISVLRLSRYNVLVQEMYSIENLSKSSVICLDKTGTITSGKMFVDKIIPFNQNIDIKSLLKSILYILDDNNQTSLALKEYCKDIEFDNREYLDKINFSSKRKYSAVTFSDGYTYIMGAFDFISNDIKKEIVDKANEFMEEGKRVLAIFRTQEKIKNFILPDNLEIISLIIIEEEIRENVKECIEYIYNQNVDIKIISGDNPITVSSIAKKVGIRNFNSYIDVSKLSNDDLKRAVAKYTIFVRATPFQKKQIIQELKKLGHTVAMTGDGINDTLALRESDCSIAMASGSDSARNVSSIILLDSNFQYLYKIIEEGRRTINNIQRTSSLFISKTIYSSLLGFLFILVNLRYPFSPIQMSIINITCIGIPSFFLSFESNFSRVTGDFMKNILYFSFPTSICVFLNIFLISMMGTVLDFNLEYLSTICLLVTEFSSLFLVYEISKPLNRNRFILFVFVVSLFVVSVLFFGDILSIQKIDLQVIIVTCLFILPTFIFRIIGRNIYHKFMDRRKFIV